MKIFILLLLTLATFGAAAQSNTLLKTNDFDWKNGITVKDTVTAISIVGNSFNVVTDGNLALNFTMSFISKKGGRIDGLEVTKNDLINASRKAGLPESQIPAFVMQVYQGIIFGTIAQKVQILNQLLNGYGITVKPATQQDGIFGW